MLYDKLLILACNKQLEVYERDLKGELKGLYCGGIIWLSNSLETRKEKAAKLSEEIGHHETSAGDILDQTSIPNKKQEKRARAWGYCYVIPLSKIVEVYNEGLTLRHEIAEYIGVTEDFLQSTIDYYRDKFGLYTDWNDYRIYFDPLNVTKHFR